MKLQRNFTAKEFACKCGLPNCTDKTGENIDPVLVDKLQLLRDEYVRMYGHRSFIITSGIRCQYHPIEAAKSTKTGTHLNRIAVDIACTSSAERFRILELAFKLGFQGIAYSKTFIHLDIREEHATWVY